MKNLEKRNGVVSIAAMLVLGAVVVQIGLVGFILSYYLNAANAGVKFASYAFSGAQAGIAEGILRVVRSEYNPLVPNSFSLTLTSGALVTVTLCAGETPPPPSGVQCEPVGSGLDAN